MEDVRALEAITKETHATPIPAQVAVFEPELLLWEVISIHKKWESDDPVS